MVLVSFLSMFFEIIRNILIMFYEEFTAFGYNIFQKYCVFIESDYMKDLLNDTVSNLIFIVFIILMCILTAVFIWQCYNIPENNHFMRLNEYELMFAKSINFNFDSSDNVVVEVV